jgi:hypothetical protein
MRVSDSICISATASGVYDVLASVSQRNPFRTVAYVNAMRILGYEGWLLGSRASNSDNVAVAFLKYGRLNRELTIPSLPEAAQQAEFWNDLYAFAKRRGITRIIAESFGSPSITLPALHGETFRESKLEYVLKLQEHDLDSLLSSNHKRNIKKAQSSNLCIEQSRRRSSCDQHLRLMGHSRTRRLGRGESLPEVADPSQFYALLDAGAGDLFQAYHNGTAVASVLVLRAPGAAYYHSAGTSKEGMRIGASHFLVHSIGEQLKREGTSIFNLGGCVPGSSLARFKDGFGPVHVQVASAQCYLGEVWRRKLSAAISLARSDPAYLRTAIKGSLQKLFVYAVDCRRPLSTRTIPDAEFRVVTRDDISAIPKDAANAAFRQNQLDQFATFGEGYSFGVYMNGDLAHVSWLLPSDALTRIHPPVLQLKDDEAEITGCETLPSFRRRGIYCYAIGRLVAAARSRGFRQIYMKTQEGNVASQAGIIQAGLHRIGTVILFSPPCLPSKRVVIRRICVR